MSQRSARRTYRSSRELVALHRLLSKFGRSNIVLRVLVRLDSALLQRKLLTYVTKIIPLVLTRSKNVLISPKSMKIGLISSGEASY